MTDPEPDGSFVIDTPDTAPDDEDVPMYDDDDRDGDRIRHLTHPDHRNIEELPEVEADE